MPITLSQRAAWWGFGRDKDSKDYKNPLCFRIITYQTSEGVHYLLNHFFFFFCYQHFHDTAYSFDITEIQIKAKWFKEPWFNYKLNLLVFRPIFLLDNGTKAFPLLSLWLSVKDVADQRAILRTMTPYPSIFFLFPLTLTDIWDLYIKTVWMGKSNQQIYILFPKVIRMCSHLNL